MGDVIPFPSKGKPAAFKGYSFAVQIWEEDGKFMWSVVQEFEKVSGDEFEPLAYGEADSFAEASKQASAEIQGTF